MTINEALKSATEKFSKLNISSAQLDAQLLLSATLHKPKEFLIAHSGDILTDAQIKKFDEFTKRRLDREPVCYITNQIEFYGLDLYIDNRALSPRVETELVTEQAIKNAPKNSTLIDIGTGSGAIAVAIAKHRPDLAVVATEISKDALEVAKKNAEAILGKDHKIKFMVTDIFEGVTGTFETVVTNLPYVSEDYKPRMKPEVAKEPAVALFGGPGDGLDLYRRFYAQLPKHIQAGSLVYHESDPWQHQELTKLATKAGLKPILEDYLILGFQKP